jgi:hypothetical protein
LSIARINLSWSPEAQTLSFRGAFFFWPLGENTPSMNQSERLDLVNRFVSANFAFRFAPQSDLTI